MDTGMYEVSLLPMLVWRGKDIGKASRLPVYLLSVTNGTTQV